MHIKLLFLLIGLSLTLLAVYSSKNSVKAAGGDTPVVVELFTSQSCSSCPPADKVLGEISIVDNVITLSCHVTYWNHLHWEDTLSREFCTQRQRGYAAVMPGGRVYTPQAVINGRQHIIGSRKAKMLAAIRNARGVDRVVSLTMKRNDKGGISLELPDFDRKGKYQISLFEYKLVHLQNIPSGENKGKSVVYTHPVSAMRILDIWTGHQEQLDLEMTDSRAGAMAVIVQDGVSGHIVAAGDLRL